MNSFSKEEMFNLLSSSICNVKFQKANGEMRDMNCTLLENIIPTVTSQSVFDEHVQPVYDIEKNAWRSFRWDSLKEFNGMPL
jgi:hypothetical protein